MTAPPPDPPKRPEMPLEDPPQQDPPERLDQPQIQAIYDQFAERLERFLLGVLKDDAAAADAMQLTLVKLMEKGHLVLDPSSMKSWLFRVAFNEAMLIRRKQATGRRHAEGMAWHFQTRIETASGGSQGQAVGEAIQAEDIELVRAALNQLSDVQREVVEKRIYEGKKFREIAEELSVPLGTVLARMQSSLKKLKPILAEPDED